jgi:hypothetical protein
MMFTVTELLLLPTVTNSNHWHVIGHESSGPQMSDSEPVGVIVGCRALTVGHGHIKKPLLVTIQLEP